MGTYAEVEIENSSMADSAVATVREIFDRVDRTMSIYKPQSDLSKINFAAGRAAVAVDPWVGDIIEKSRTAYGKTGGAFSINVLAHGIRLGIKPAFAMPSHLGESLSHIGDDSIQVSPTLVSLPLAGMGLDLGGIAKGYALDRAAEALLRMGVRRFLLSLGRQVYAADAPFGRKGWPVQIEGEEEIRYIRNESISVSQQGVMTDTGHIVDPRTGIPVSGERWIAVSASQGWIADMASTALMVNPGLVSKLESDYPEINWIQIRRTGSEPD